MRIEEVKITKGCANSVKGCADSVRGCANSCTLYYLSLVFKFPETDSECGVSVELGSRRFRDFWQYDAREGLNLAD